MPRTLGRYRVLGELATGGMAEILLARLDGPSGFSRPVVIKRILPHLARQPRFVAMFLDEARTVAGIRHPNVVQVQELWGEDDGELFLVMEYLEGEPVSGLMKRLKSAHGSLSARLCAYIVAELCAGLHAAHELEDDRGVSKRLVHRDVSPQNVFVTYDGHVKLLDFGVALTRDRMTRTEAGQLKGKLQYMSPEQCSGKPLDRRSDIFALGIVLYELLTGRLLFKRDSSAATLRAICDEPVLPPSRIAAVPAALDTICVRALAHDPDDRFATCAEMRAALLGIAHNAASGAPETELGDVMRSLFADRIRDKLDMVRSVEAGAVSIAVPPGETDQGVELPTVPATPVRMPRPAARARRWPALVAIAGVAAVAIGALVAERQRHAPAERAPAAARPAPSNAMPRDAATAPIATADAAAPSAGGDDLPATVAVEVISTPPGATVRVVGAAAPRGVTPLELELPAASHPVQIELSVAGHVTQQRALVPDRAQRVEIVLPRRPSSRSARRKSTEEPGGFRRFD